MGECSRDLLRLAASLTGRRLQRGAFPSPVDPQPAINRYFGEYNRKPKPFVWTADPNRIIERLSRGVLTNWRQAAF
jgi:hypothetical protein